MALSDFAGPVNSENGFEWAGTGVTIDVVSAATRISSASISMVSKLAYVRAAWVQFVHQPGAQLSSDGVARVSVRWSGATLYLSPWKTASAVAPSASYGATIAVFAIGETLGSNRF